MISDITPVNNYTGNGSTTSFDFDFYIENESQLKVYLINSDEDLILLTKDVDYSVNEFTVDSSRPTPDYSEGGYIIYPITGSSHTTLSTNEKISLQLDIPFSQESEYQNSSLLNLSNLEFSFDYLTRLTQILKRQVDRCAKLKEGSTVNPETLSQNINKLADISGDITTVATSISDVIIASDNTQNISTVAGSISDINSVAGGLSDISAVKNKLTEIGNVAGDLTNIDSVAGALSNINAVNSNIANIDSVAGALSNINAVNNKLTEINNVADDLTNIDSVAGALSDINAVKNKLTEIGNVADDITNIDSVAGALSNINAVGNKITEIGNVADDLINIDSVAGALGDIGAVKNKLTEINNVADDLTNIDSVAGALSDITAVKNKLTEIGNVSDDLTNINSVASDLYNIYLVKNNLTEIGDVAENMFHIHSVSYQMTDILYVRAKLTEIGNVAGDLTNIDSVAGALSNINAVNSNIANIDSVAGALSNINAVNNKLTEINNVADDLININAVANDLTNINNASTYADNANVWAEGTDEEVQALGGVHSAKGWAEESASGQIQADWSQSDDTKKDYIKNKPNFASVATSGSYNDLKNQPTIPTQTDVQINGTSITSNGVANILTNTAYSSSNKIATMSDIPGNEIAIVYYGSTPIEDILLLYNNGKKVYCKENMGDLLIPLWNISNSEAVFSGCVSTFSIVYTCTPTSTPYQSQWAQQTIFFEETSNKVTSISSASTDTQYPTAKLLYDQLALKQNTSTAVTHTENTGAGSSTNPIYINSSGVATASTGNVGNNYTPIYMSGGFLVSSSYSISEGRFDGQWTNKNSSLSTSTSKGSYTISLSSYLPSDNYKYEVLIQYKAYRSGSGDSIGAIKSDIVTDYMNIGIANANARQAYNCFTIPVGTGRVLYYQISTNNLDGTNMYAIAYRRLGTNS